MDHKDYWIETVVSSFEEHGIAADAGQIERVALDVKVSHENYDTAFGYDVASANLSGAKDREIAQLHKELQAERAKVHCKSCNGKGYTVENCGTRSSQSTCSKCRGEGRHAP